jgi:hypothetical protein
VTEQTQSDRARVATTQEIIETVERIRELPYVWPHDHTADAARADGYGSCASKHALLAEELAAIGVASRPLFVKEELVPPQMADDPELAEACETFEIHELLTVYMPESGPVLVDITWDPALIARGFPGELPWDGRSDMPIAGAVTEPGWAAPPTGHREAKETLRSRLYGPGEREVRDRGLEIMSKRFAEWRAEAGDGNGVS